MQINYYKCVILELYPHLDYVIQQKRDNLLWSLVEGLGSDLSQLL